MDIFSPFVAVYEGPDGAGKSYAIERIAGLIGQTHLRMPILHHNGPPEPGTTSRQLYQHYKRQLVLAVALREKGYSTIIDRSFLSEAVYGRVFRKRSLLTTRQVRRLERFCVKNDVELIAVETPSHIRQHRIEARGETWDDAQFHIGAIYNTHFRHSGAWITASGLLAPSQLH